jgi:hypothetical protein
MSQQVEIVSEPSPIYFLAQCSDKGPSIQVVCANPFSEQAEVVMDVASERFFLRLDARSFNTIVLDG